MTWIPPLDLETILVSNMAGSVEIFAFISILVIASMAAFFRMSGGTFFLMLGIFGLVIGTIYAGVLFLVILLGGTFAMWALNKALKN